MYQYDDGGRAAAGFKGEAGDCAVRAIAIATGKPYRDVYDDLREATKEFAKGRSRAAVRAANNTSPRNGVPMPAIRRYMESMGWQWTPTMLIGSGCKVHLRPEELPPGPLLVRVTRHICAVVDGVIRDTHDPSRDGTRCVYGYFSPS